MIRLWVCWVVLAAVTAAIVVTHLHPYVFAVVLSAWVGGVLSQTLLTRRVNR